MSDLVGHPEDRFSRDAAHIIKVRFKEVYIFTDIFLVC